MLMHVCEWKVRGISLGGPLNGGCGGREGIATKTAVAYPGRDDQVIVLKCIFGSNQWRSKSDDICNSQRLFEHGSLSLH